MNNRYRFAYQLASFKCAMPCHRPSRDRSVFRLPQAGQFFYAVQVDQDRRTGQPEIHYRNEALSASQQLCIIAMLVE
jgi:hypothetical protein